MWKDFKAFIMRGNVLDMAVGIIIGAAFGKIVTSLVNDILMPPIGVVIGGVDFSRLAIPIRGFPGQEKPVTVNYGAFINNVLDFLIVAFCVFLVVKMFEKLKKNPPPPPPSEKPCPQCLMSIPIAAKRCGHCTSQL